MAPSRFIKKNLEALKDKSTSHSSPLSVFGHIDLDAFYAQCEQVRLGLTADDPVVCRQWSSLIAVSYAARKFGISRMTNIDEARKKCPNLIAPHVATYMMGETTWHYYDEPKGDKHKVSLDPFRCESRKIFQLFKKHCKYLEKASIDETFADVGYLVYDVLVAHFPRLAILDDNDHLPELSTISPELNFKGTVFGVDDPPGKDWDDLTIMVGSMIIADMRQDLFDTLGYTCSAGIGRNKRIAKLASGFNKPNQQTVVINSKIDDFLAHFELNDLWGFGGKLGNQISSQFKLPEKGSIKFLLDIPMNKLTTKLGDSLGPKVYEIIRGQGSSEIVTRVDIKSMQSVKQFSRPMQSIEDCHAWFKVFAADVANRILELDAEMESPRRPRTITIHAGQYKPKKVTRSKQTAFDKSLPLNISLQGLIDSIYQQQCFLFEVLRSETGETLLPCSSLSMGVTNFEVAKDSHSKVIDTFLKKNPSEKVATDEKVMAHEKLGSETENEEKSLETYRSRDTKEVTKEDSEEGPLFFDDEYEPRPQQDGGATVTCERCKKQLTFDDYDEHKDWHFAVDLQDQFNGVSKLSQKNSVSYQKTENSGPPTPKKRKNTNVEGNQNLLKYFKAS